MLEETDEQKQERLRKWRREMGGDPLLSLPMEEMRTGPGECLAAELIKTPDCSR